MGKGYYKDGLAKMNVMIVPPKFVYMKVSMNKKKSLLDIWLNLSMYDMND